MRSPRVRPAQASHGLLVPAVCLMTGTGAIVASASGHANALDVDVLRLGAWLAGPLAGAVILDRQPRHPVGLVLAASGTFPMLALLAAVWRTGALPSIAATAGSDLPAIAARLGLGIGVLAAARRADGLLERRMRWLVVLVLITASLAGAIALTDALVEGTLAGYLTAALHAAAVSGVAALVVHRHLPDLGFAFIRLALLTAATMVLGLTYGLGLVSLSWTGFPNHPAAAAAVTALAAVALLPVYTGVRDRLSVSLYGAGQRPHLALALLSHSLDTAGEAGDVLRAACEAVASAVRSPSATVVLRDPAPAAPPGAITVLLQAGGEFVGTLVLAPRRPGESFSRREVDLVTTLAAPLTQVARAAGLAAALELARRELAVQRLDERRRLRRDLHDGLGPLLSGLGLRLDALERLVPGDLRQQVGDLKDAVASSRREVRRLVAGLAPEERQTVDLEQSLAEMVQGWGSATAALGLRFECDFTGPISALTEQARVAAYRIAGEAITNVVRHARATTCIVAVHATSGGGLVLEIRDDGVGLRTGTRGFGLRSMQERAAAVGGTIEIHVPEDGGTVVRLTLFAVPVEVPG